MEKYLLEMRNIYKSFPGIRVLKGINFNLNRGEVHALVGENGAGKSTLINVLGGIYSKDDGNIIIDDKNVNINNVLIARNNGISIIHQELVLVPYLTVAENIFINREPNKYGFIDYNDMYTTAQHFIDELGLSIRATDKVKGMTVAQQQMVEIVKAVSFNAKIIVMDEPTSSLSDKEIDALFEYIKILKQRGIGIIYISHRLSELSRIADRVTVLRDGETTGTYNINEITNDEIIRLMVGREVVNYYTRTFNKSGDIVLEVKNLSSPHIKNISFNLKAGEILGISGLVGAGRTEVIKAILGFDKVTSGELFLYGRKIKINKPSQAYNLRIGFIPENRREESIFPIQSMRFNLSIRVLKDFIGKFIVNFTKERKLCDEYIKKLSIKVASQDTKMQNMSGGNQQKVIIARWLAAHPKILIMDEPTRGIDVGAKAEIYNLMNDLAQQGLAIIMISSELPEIINMSDRVIVMREGMISRVIEKCDLSQEEIMKYAVNI